jgi:hypothetical protein
MSWFDPLEVPIVLPGGRQIRTLDDARAWLLALPDPEVNSEAVGLAVRTLTKAADRKCPIGDAHIAILNILAAEALFLVKRWAPQVESRSSFTILRLPANC